MERYDRIAARHYAAYRPPIHQRVLERVIDSREFFESGLDVGCGTGCSAVALANYCHGVVGIDSSQAMLDRADPHPKIAYVSGTVDSTANLPGQPYGIVTFAGSLSYIDSRALKAWLPAACDRAGTIVVYDFKMAMDELLERSGIAVLLDRSVYDYEADFSDWSEFETVAREYDRVRIEVSPQQAAHLILSDSSHFDAVQRVLESEDSFDGLVSKFQKSEAPIALSVDYWVKRYRFV